MALGLPKHRVEVHAYDPEWPDLFAVEAKRIAKGLGDRILAIEHIGSTAVPGLDAKPIIDIAVAVPDFNAAFDDIPLFEELGYGFKGEVGVPGRHFFMLGRPRTHHLHVYEIASDDWRQRLAFRDYLRTHPEAIQEYRALKLRLAREFPNDITSYGDGKREFIDRITALSSS